MKRDHVLKRNKLWMLALLIVFVFSLTLGVQAAPKVVKIQKKQTYSSGREYVKIYGVSSSGQKVWKYKCSSSPAAQGSHVSVCSNDKYVFIVDGSTFIRLKKKNGAVVCKRKNVDVWPAVAMVADSDNSVYMASSFGQRICKLSKNGKVIWSNYFDRKSLWPNKIKISGNNLKVYFGGSYRGYHKTATVNKKTGKIKKYTNY